MIKWFDDFLGIAYRYYDLRMNVVPLFTNRRYGLKIWQDVVHWWPDMSIRIRFVESDEKYWFVMGSESRRSDSNMSFCKRLSRSTHYERFKSGYGEAAYLRFGEYSVRNITQAKDSDVCNCGHPAGDHAYDDTSECLEDGCGCSEYASTQIYLLKRKKTITDILFIDESQAREDPLAWNCINANSD